MKSNPFTSIVGNDHIKEYLMNMVAKQAISNSLLFAGTDGIGKSLFAEALALMVLKTERDINAHPDVYIYRPEGKLGMHSIDAMRHFSEKVYLAPFESKWKIFIIHDAERMLPSSSNALLKTFEEPAHDSIIILLSSNPSMLLPTVLSRCRTIRFHHIEESSIVSFLIDRHKVEKVEAEKVAKLAFGSIGRAVKMRQEQNEAIRKYMIQVLATGRFTTYTELMEAAKQISAHVDEGKKLEEEAVKTALIKGYPPELTAIQQQALDKEIDGAVALRQAEFAASLFEIVLSWYRDLELLNAQASRKLLINRDFEAALLQSAPQQCQITLEYVQKTVAEAKLLLERSTAMPIVLENLFLKLNFL